MNAIITLTLCLLSWSVFAQPEIDQPFRQPVSVKFELPSELKGAQLKKVLVNYDDIVYLLTDRGLYRNLDQEMVPDISYRPLAKRIPVDISVQEKTGHLYYLYNDQFLTNAYGGKPYANLPSGHYQKLAVNEEGDVLLTGTKRALIWQNSHSIDLKLPAGSPIALEVHHNQFYYLTEDALYKLQDGNFNKIYQENQLQSVAFRNQEAILGTAKGYFTLDLLTGQRSSALQTELPVTDIRDLLVTADGMWAATPEGAFLRQSNGKFRYFASLRWLDQDQVNGLATNSNGDVFMLTPTGLNMVHFKKTTLEDKAMHFEQKVRQRHIRYGFIAELKMSKPADISTAEMIDTDNDGLWTAFYLGSQAFRFATTGEEKAWRNAWEAFEAYERLLSLNQLKGFPSRTFERKGFKISDPDRWRDSPDQEWEWKGHTSTDEFVAYIFVASVLDEFIARTESEKERVAAFIDAILTHIIENNYYFVDIDGKPTLWGRWNPEYINWYPPTIRDRRLGSLHLIAGLQLGYALTGKEIYKNEANRMMEEHGYLENIQIDLNNIKPTPGYIHQGHDMGDGGWNHSDDEMSFLTYWVIHKYAFTPELRKIYEASIRNHWEIEKPERNALWHLITLATEGSFDRESTLWFLRDYPWDVIRYQTRNSHRKDLTFLEPNFRNQQTEELLPAAERSLIRYNGNPFVLDAGHGNVYELSGAEYLMPYWLARYLKVLE